MQESCLGHSSTLKSSLLRQTISKVWQPLFLMSMGCCLYIVTTFSHSRNLGKRALRSAVKSVVQPVLSKTSMSSSIRKARRKTRPEDVAERRGRKAWPNGVAGKRGRKAWSEGVAERRGRKTCLPESQDCSPDLWRSVHDSGPGVY